MKSKTAKNVMIATAILLGASYILEKSIKSKKRQQEVEKSKKIDNNMEMNKNSSNYILLKEFYNNHKDNSSLLSETSKIIDPKTITEVEISEKEDEASNSTNRKYHILPRQKVKNTITDGNYQHKKVI